MSGGPCSTILTEMLLSAPGFVGASDPHRVGGITALRWFLRFSSSCNGHIIRNEEKNP